MKKNVASQVIGAQMVTAADGTAFAGAVTAYVTGDGSTQAVGSVSSGACTHEGNGFHTYAPAQAETNYDHVAFTFIGTGAIPATVQMYTTFPQAGDNFARLGAPAGASVSADVAAIKAETATILSDTNDIQTRLPAALVSGRMDSSTGAMAANVLTATAIAADAITDAKVAADVTIASVTGAVGSVTAGVAVAVGGIATTSFAAGAIDAAAIAADAIGAAELSQAACQKVADEALNRDLAGGASGGSRNVRNALRSLRNKAAIAAGTLTVYAEDDSTPAWTAAVATTAGDPISSIDPV